MPDMVGSSVIGGSGDGPRGPHARAPGLTPRASPPRRPGGSLLSPTPIQIRRGHRGSGAVAGARTRADRTGGALTLARPAERDRGACSMS
jgi:hypothetical protein